MVTDFILDMFFQFANWVLSLFPEWEIPPFMTSWRQYLIDALALFDGLGVWFDWTIIGVCLAAVSITYAVTILIRLIRAIVTYVPFIGGGGA